MSILALFLVLVCVEVNAIGILNKSVSSSLLLIALESESLRSLLVT